MKKKKIVFQVGGPSFVGGPKFHPVSQQAGCIVHWLGSKFIYDLRYLEDAHVVKELLIGPAL